VTAFDTFAASRNDPRHQNRLASIQLLREHMNTPPAVAIILSLLAIVTATGRAQSVTRPASSAPTPLATLAKALSGKWQLQVRFEPASATGNKAIEGSGEESWSLGPGGIDIIEQEHIPSPYGETFLMGVIWWDSTKQQLAGMECNSHLSFTCDLKGALNDITMTWDGKRSKSTKSKSTTASAPSGTSTGPTSRQPHSFSRATSRSRTGLPYGS
jgi:hypothetical protein